MRPMHPSTADGIPDDSVGRVLLVPVEVNEIPFNLGAGGFRWYQEETGDEVGDEILAWAATDEAKIPTPGAPPDHVPARGTLP